MRKVIVLLIALFLMSSIVMAQGQGNAPDDVGRPETTGMPDETGQPELINMPEDAGKPDDVGKPEKAGKPKVTGLEMALTKVTNENARARLQTNMEAFEARVANRTLEDVEVEEVDEETGEVKIKAKEQVKYFGFIKGKATKRFNLDNEGKLTEKAPWYRFLYADSSAE
ncbi:hypothetical protein HQ533_03215 [Candidatus Woesearchaeota archaeon]|nr:hypothetical protein [Candidatus Woesearchaeota archaeon]